MHGCIDAFETFAQLELHLDVGKLNLSKLNQFDAIRRDWALKFTSVSTENPKACSPDSTKLQTSLEDPSASVSLQRGWAMSKPRSNARFSEKVKEYLTARFALGVKSGRR